MKNIFLLLWITVLFVPDSCAQDTDSGSIPKKTSWYNRLRFDSEFRFAVPPEKESAVWNYLLIRYKNPEILLGTSKNSSLILSQPSPERDTKEVFRGAILKNQGSPYLSRFAEELFLDTYYDTRNLHVLDAKAGVRYRRRFYEKEPGKMSPDKELVQIKFNSENPSDTLVRGEFKFPVKSKKKKNDSAPQPEEEKKQREPDEYVYKMVKKKEQKDFLEKATLLKTDPMKLRRKLDLEQLRKRVYILRNDTTFITLTLDLVNSKKWGIKAHFAEVEFEINEKVFTVSDTNTRNRLWNMLKLLEDDLVKTFPDLVQDQLPKYNKMANQFEKKIPAFRFWLRNEKRIILILVCLVIFGVGAPLIRKKIR
ncbi:MAG: hypothetical protein A3H98_04035 [Bacteroidetes bacterium RIFCSPLOWO2_02_FULL_36_8]|nr:MAG: hypothetical protein A3H98_04035 [Bacteroidetes bacterium RIFCSPLOWO2_02_FULL_36_8]OFY68803.1 MAG: hypothetical protein A3G23_03160 [Bacteroidetes bacterium RIFCSPLOWO2_12_FULL_37_12]